MLKTLKDFKRKGNKDIPEILENNTLIELLKQEAIKYLKDFEKSPCFENDGLKTWIKDFFNIEEKDL